MKTKQRQTPCSRCRGLCCRYITLCLDTPQERRDFEELRWYLAHHDVQIYVQDGVWYCQVTNKCRHLTKDSQCETYSERPWVCREYKPVDCDVTPEEYDYELFFENDTEMAAYIAIRFDNKKADSQRARRRGRRK